MRELAASRRVHCCFFCSGATSSVSLRETLARVEQTAGAETISFLLERDGRDLRPVDLRSFPGAGEQEFRCCTTGMQNAKLMGLERGGGCGEFAREDGRDRKTGWVMVVADGMDGVDAEDVARVRRLGAKRYDALGEVCGGRLDQQVSF